MVIHIQYLKEKMATLADSFIDDLDELGDSDNEEEEIPKYQIKKESKSSSSNSNKGNADNNNNESDNEDDTNNDDILDKEDLDRALLRMVASKASSNIGLLRSSTRYKNHLIEVEEATSDISKLQLHLQKEDSKHILENDPEYKLILLSNKIIQEIDEEIIGTQRYVTEIYSKKFPELDSLINNKIDYINTVKRIGNEMDMTLVELNDLLPSALVMIVSVTGSTTSGKLLLSLLLVVNAVNATRVKNVIAAAMVFLLYLPLVLLVFLTLQFLHNCSYYYCY